MSETIRPSALEVFLGDLQASVGVTSNDAKMEAYYAIATYGLKQLEKFPILVLSGPMGTGKTTQLQIIRNVASNPCKSLIDGTATRPAIRDSLVNGGTSVIDEADAMDEGLLIKRYSRTSASVTVKRQVADGWVQETKDRFGATVLHRRKPFRDPAVLSRSITIRTRLGKPTGILNPDDFSAFQPVMQGIGEVIDWSAADQNQSRIRDTWEPLLVVARQLRDFEWLEFAEREISKAESELKLGQEEEPEPIVFTALMTVAIPNGSVRQFRDRVALSDVAHTVLSNGHNLNSWQVGQLLRRMGFQTAKRGGTQYVLIGSLTDLVQKGRELNVEDELFGEIAKKSREESEGE